MCEQEPEDKKLLVIVFCWRVLSDFIIPKFFTSFLNILMKNFTLQKVCW